MIFAVVGVVIAFNVSLYLVLATFLKDNKRKASTVDFPELKGLVSKGNKKVAWTRARSSLAGRSILNTRPQGMLRRLKSLCTPRVRKEDLPLFSIDCTDFTPCQTNGLYKAHSWPPSAGTFMPPPGSPPLPLSRAGFMRTVPDGPSLTPASAAVLSPPVMSAEEPMMSAQKPTAEHMSAAALAPAAAEVAEGLLRQALRTLYKQHYGVPSVTVPKEETEQDSYCFMERQHSPTTPLDTIGSLDALSPSPFHLVSPPMKPAAALAAPDQQKMDVLAAAAAAPPKPPALPKTPAPGIRAPRCTDLGAAARDLAPQPTASAFAVAASCPAGFIGFEVEDDPEQELDEGRQVKSFECHLVDKLLDMSVSSLLSASSSRQLSCQLIGPHQQAKFGRVPIQNRLTA